MLWQPWNLTRAASFRFLLWAITAADEAALDRYEGWSYLYRKENVTVRLNGRNVKAMAIMNDGRPLGMPSPFCYKTIMDGYPRTSLRASTQAYVQI